MPDSTAAQAALTAVLTAFVDKVDRDDEEWQRLFGNLNTALNAWMASVDAEFTP